MGKWCPFSEETYNCDNRCALYIENKEFNGCSFMFIAQNSSQIISDLNNIDLTLDKIKRGVDRNG